MGPKRHDSMRKLQRQRSAVPSARQDIDEICVRPEVYVQNERIFKDRFLENETDVLSVGEFGAYSEFITFYNGKPWRKNKTVVKKLKFEGNGTDLEEHFRREIHFARLKHPFILPVFAATKSATCGWLVYPEMARRNLYDAINADSDKRSIKLGRAKPQEDMLLHQSLRIRIAFQVIRALLFLHTPVPNKRGVVKHGNVTSYNIVLDENKNARLTGFGYSEEVMACDSASMDKHPHAQSDISMFREVLMELILNATRDSDDYETREMQYNSPDASKSPPKTAWSQKYWKEMKSLVHGINEKADDGQTDIYLIQKELNGLCLSANIKDIIPPEGNCVSCLVNPRASLKYGGKCGRFCRRFFCSACTGDCDRNPLDCPKSGHHRKSTHEKVHPPIGKHVVLLLLAGDDKNDMVNASAFENSIEDIQEIFSGRHPCKINLGKDDVIRVITSNCSEGETVKEIVCKAFDKSRERLETIYKEMSETSLKTEPVYFVLHYVGHGKQGALCLDNRTDLTEAVLSEMLGNIINVAIVAGVNMGEKLDENLKQKTNDLKDVVLENFTVLAILDSCHAGSIDLSKHGFGRIIQVSSCKAKETMAIMGPREEFPPITYFSQFFIQALSGDAKACIFDRQNCRCHICASYFETGNRKQYIPLMEYLLPYLRHHLEEYAMRSGKTEQHPRCSGSFDEDMVLSYFPRREEIKFILDAPAHNVFKKVQVKTQSVKGFCEYNTTYEIVTTVDSFVLKKDLRDLLMSEMNLDIYPQSNYVEIRCHVDHQEDKSLFTGEDVLDAWHAGKELYVSFRQSPKKVHDGPVMYNDERKFIRNWLEEEERLRSQDGQIEDILGIKRELQYPDRKWIKITYALSATNPSMHLAHYWIEAVADADVPEDSDDGLEREILLPLCRALRTMAENKCVRVRNLPLITRLQPHIDDVNGYHQEYLNRCSQYYELKLEQTDCVAT